MGLVQESDIRGMLQDPELMTAIAKAIVETPATADSLAADIADQMGDELEEAPELRKQIVETAMASPEFKTNLVGKLLTEIEDD